jgi:hypothetical protein
MPISKKMPQVFNAEAKNYKEFADSKLDNKAANLNWEVKEIPVTKEMLKKVGNSNLDIKDTNSYALRFE